MQKNFFFWGLFFLLFLAKDNCFAQTGSSTTVKLTDKNSFLAHYKPAINFSQNKFTLLTEDLIFEPEKALSASSEAWNVDLSADKKNIVFSAKLKNAPAISVLRLVTKDETIDFLLRKIPSANLDNYQAKIDVFTQVQKDGTLTVRSAAPLAGVIAFWENSQITPVRVDETHYTITIPEAAKKWQRSHLRIWTSNKEMLNNELLFPLEYGKVVQNATQLNRHDWEAQIMYFPLMDRFYNGNKDNDAPLHRADIGPKQNFQGGDIAGITQKINDGFFDKLSVNCLWLSPITQNPEGAYQEYIPPQRWYSGYHGYWPISSSKIDHHFGTDDELHILIKTAHQHGMNVILDYVCHHVHTEHSIYQEHPDWVTPMYLPDGTRNLRLWDGETRTTTWFDTFLPTLNFSNPEVNRLQSDSALYWIKKFKFDGFRHDATKHVPVPFWRMLTYKMQNEVVIPEQRNVYQIGETYGSNELISEYIGNGLLDAQFDFNSYYEMRDVLIKEGESSERLAKSLLSSWNWYGNYNTMANITGNHDNARFMALAGKGIKPGENDKEVGWEREVIVEDSTAYEKIQILAGLIFTIPGIPTIYYGDEFGMVGANDPDNRRLMRFDGYNHTEAQTKETFEKLAALRKNNICLTYGDANILQAEKNTLVYKRQYLGKAALVFFNIGDEKASINLEISSNEKLSNIEATMGNRFSYADNQLVVDLPAFQFEIIMCDME